MTTNAGETGAPPAVPEETTVEVARAETERGELVLRRRTTSKAADVWELRAGGVFVMDSQQTSTETELAALALERVEHPRRVIVGGLGLGFTLQRVLADQRVEEVVVVEIEERLVRWMREGTVPFGPAILADKRVRVVNADILTALGEVTTRHDLLLLDVDNGPGYLVHETNAGVYEHDFVATTKRILNPGGVLAVWSAARAPELLDVLTRVYGDAEEQRFDVLLGDRPEEYFLYLAQRRVD